MEWVRFELLLTPLWTGSRSSPIPLLLLSVLLVGILSGTVKCQDDAGMDDVGSEGGQLDYSDVEVESDQAEGGVGEGNGGGGKKKKLTYFQMSTLAIQQLAIIIGVAFMVGFLFMAMIAFEQIWVAVEGKYQAKFGNPEEEVEDPAALVGTFKRYKN